MATPAPKPEPQPRLELAGLSMSFGGLVVIDNLDLVVNEREVVSVIGPNGAGKTTLFNLITGIYLPDAGEIRLDGESLVGLPPHKIARRGAARTFQTLRLFLNMTVIENVMASQYGQTKVGIAARCFAPPRCGGRSGRSGPAPRRSSPSSESA
jgi:ABC-type branched-chain amino acid transport systems, ATPase component